MNFFLIGMIIIVISILIAFALIIKDVRIGKYEIAGKTVESILGKEAEIKYAHEFPEHSITDLKNEIEVVADILINNEPSNRYTERLRQKAAKDERIQEIREAIQENVEIVKYIDGNLKARVRYRDLKNKYLLILSMNTVATGRVFLNDYFIFKDKLNLKEAN